MTTVTVPAGTGATPLGRILRVVKLNLANPWTTIITPWIILAAIFVLSYAIWIMVFLSIGSGDPAEAEEGMQFSGAGTWIFFYLMVVAVQAMNLTFPLALGFGSTRRDFYLGSSLTFALISAMWAAGLTILGAIESATNGWGIGGRMFTTIYFGGPEAPIWQRFVVFLCVSLFFFFIGAAVASVYVRWRVLGMVVFFFLLGLLLIAALAFIFLTESWPAVGQFFITYQAFGVALWMLIPTVIAGLAGYLVLRRATPR